MKLNLAGGVIVAGLLAGLGGGSALAQTVVAPGQTVELPLPIKNADDNGDPGGDTIGSMKVIVTGDSAFVTQATESEMQSIAPGESKTFTPSFVVGSGPGVVDGQTYTVRLKQVSPDPGIDPDLADPASEVVIGFTICEDPLTAGGSPEAAPGEPRMEVVSPAVGKISGTYGMRSNPFTGVVEFHPCINFAGPEGDPVTASASGRVKGACCGGGLSGNLAKLEHGSGVETVYGHLAQCPDKSKDDPVSRGDRIGSRGSTGQTTGPNALFCVKADGMYVDPMAWLYRYSTMKEALDSLAGLSASMVSENLLPHDPNAMYGPSGQVVPGQTMRYVVEFENEGEGAAFGVYVTDVFDSSLDASAIVVKDFALVDWETNAETATTLPYRYDPNSRTLTVLAGDFGPRKGGRFTVEVRLRSDVPTGTVVSNYATVYFPTVLEETRTNAIVSVVPYPTQLSYAGAAKAAYSDFALLESLLTGSGKALPGKEVVFTIGASSSVARTDAAGTARYASRLELFPGVYPLKAEFPGDGYYYLPSWFAGSLEVVREKTVLSNPSATVVYPSAATVAVAMTDDEGEPILHQEDEPKTVLLEYLDNAAWKALARARLSGGTAKFEFPVPQPLRYSYDLAARFEGDGRYNPSESTGTLAVLDRTPPSITILSPQAGASYSGSAPFSIEYRVADDLDPAPVSQAFLTRLADGARVETANGAIIVPMNLVPGSWTLTVLARDSSGNQASAVTGSFEIIHDALPPRTTLVIGEPRYGADPVYISSATLLGLVAEDDLAVVGDGAGLGVSQTWFAVDDGSFSAHAASFTMFLEGVHVLKYYSTDLAGNVEAVKVSTLAVDATPPVSSLAIGAPKFPLAGALLVSSRTPFDVLAQDPVVKGAGSGLRETLFRVDAGTFAVLTGTFTLTGPDGPRVVEFFSVDNVNNAEISKSSTVLMDQTAPHLALLCPPAPGLGVCSVFKGAFPVLGTAADLHFKDYVLEHAPGKDAVSGFVTISSGSVGISSGTLGTWDTTGLSGRQTLRLTAVDQVENVSVLKTDIFVGDPGSLLVLGGKKTFNKPEGVAVGQGGLPGQDGRIYVADTNNDRVAVFSSTGGVLAFFGRSKTLDFNKPKAAAVDGSGNIYIADTNNSRVVKLGTEGQILLEMGRRETKKKGEARFKPGKGQGEFNKPSGIALDGAGNIYVSDTNNSRVQKFNSQGAFLLAFTLPPVPEEAGGKEDDDDDAADSNQEHEGPELGKPFGIALDSTGNIYVADKKGDRALKYGPEGTLVRTFGSKGHGLGQLEKPHGVAVSPSGECVVVSDSDNDRVQKFDRLGNATLVFGREGRGEDDIAFNKPAGLALDASGNLYAADRNNNRIKKFGLPYAQPGRVAEARARGEKMSAAGAAVSPYADPAFRYHDHYAFPNPARGQNPTIRAQVGMADSVEVRIYDVAGSLVHTGRPGEPAVLDDGNGKGPQYTYDYAWNVGRAGSGVYAYVVTAVKAGEEPIRKTGKMGVIR